MNSVRGAIRGCRGKEVGRGGGGERDSSIQEGGEISGGQKFKRQWEGDGSRGRMCREKEGGSQAGREELGSVEKEVDGGEEEMWEREGRGMCRVWQAERKRQRRQREGSSCMERKHPHD